MNSVLLHLTNDTAGKERSRRAAIQLTDWVFDHVQSEFNDRPRAVLDYRKPIDVFTELVALDS